MSHHQQEQDMNALAMEGINALATAATLSPAQPTSLEPPLQDGQTLYFDDTTTDPTTASIAITTKHTTKRQSVARSKVSTSAKKRRITTTSIEDVEVIPSQQTTRSGRQTVVPQDIYQPLKPQHGTRSDPIVLIPAAPTQLTAPTAMISTDAQPNADPDHAPTNVTHPAPSLDSFFDDEDMADSIPSVHDTPNQKVNLSDLHDPGLTGYYYAMDKVRRLHEKLRQRRKTKKVIRTPAEEKRRRKMAQFMVYGNYKLQDLISQAIDAEEQVIIQEMQDPMTLHSLTYSNMSRRLMALVYELDYVEDYYSPVGQVSMHLREEQTADAHN